MYGVIQLVIEDCVISKFGLTAWEQIRADAACLDVPVGGFMRHEYYPDDITMRLAASAATVLGVDLAQVLEVVGVHFVQWMLAHGYRSMLTSQGTNMLEFLNSLDDMHFGLLQGMPRLVYPRFHCFEEPGAENGVLLLDYASSRAGLASFVCGLLRGVGELIFDGNYRCSIVESRTKSDAAGLNNFTRFRIEFLSARPHTAAARNGVWGSCRRAMAHMWEHDGEADGYAFFAQNPAMAHGWVKSMQHRVASLETPSHVTALAASFDLRHLASLLVTETPEAELALSVLFCAPLEHPGGTMPVPSLGYISGPDGPRGVTTAMYSSCMMGAHAISGPSSLVRLSAGSGFRQARVRVLICVAHDPLRDGVLLQALANTPNEALLTRVEAWALLSAAWLQVRPLYVAGFLIDLLLVAMMINLLGGGGCFSSTCSWKLLAFWVLFCKELVDNIVVGARHLWRGWLVDYMCVNTLWEWLSLLFYAYFLWSVGEEHSSAEVGGAAERFLKGTSHPHSRPHPGNDAVADSGDNRKDGELAMGIPAALFAGSRCWCVLYHLRILPTVGSRLLPVVSTMGSIAPFVLVFLLMFLGFVCAHSALHSIDDVSFAGSALTSYNILLGAGEATDFEFDIPGMKMWYYAFLTLMVPVLLNILIGVLSENYGNYEAIADSILNRARARGLLRLEMCLWLRKPCWFCSSWLDGLLWLATPEGENVASPRSASSTSTCCPFLQHQRANGEASPSYAELGGGNHAGSEEASGSNEQFLWACFSELPESQPDGDLAAVKEFIDQRISSLDIDAKFSNLEAKIADLSSRVARLG